MRLFVALEIPTAVRDNLAAQIKELRNLTTKVADRRPRWVRPENLHVTLKFIGEVAPLKLDGIRGALSTIRSDTPGRSTIPWARTFSQMKIAHACFGQD